MEQWKSSNLHKKKKAFVSSNFFFENCYQCVKIKVVNICQKHSSQPVYQK